MRLLRPQRLLWRELGLAALLAAGLVVVLAGACRAKLGHHLVGDVIAPHLLTMRGLSQVTLLDVGVPVAMGGVDDGLVDVKTGSSFIHLVLGGLREICDATLGPGLFPVAGVWNGNHLLGHEVQLAAQIADFLPQEYDVFVREGPGRRGFRRWLRRLLLFEFVVDGSTLIVHSVLGFGRTCTFAAVQVVLLL